MFVGSYQLRLDEKGRLALPVRFREQVAGGMVIKKGQEHCIYGLTMARVAEQSAALAAMAPSDTSAARMRGPHELRVDGRDRARQDRPHHHPREPARVRRTSTATWSWSASTRASRSGTRPPGTPTWRSRKRPTRTWRARGCRRCRDSRTAWPRPTAARGSRDRTRTSRLPRGSTGRAPAAFPAARSHTRRRPDAGAGSPPQPPAGLHLTLFPDARRTPRWAGSRPATGCGPHSAPLSPPRPTTPAPAPPAPAPAPPALRVRMAPRPTAGPPRAAPSGAHTRI